uniref:Ricin B lectin domain-containing protein n=2 Tax=Timema TaxID=61471 RepID=A0A7R9ISK6_9NEOP|nr:unnamed protein product [Timema tahoe]
MQVQSLLCLDTLQRANKEVQYILGVYPCHKSDMPSQFMSLTNTGELRHEEMCAEIQGFSTNKLPLPVTMYVCHGQQGNQMWLLSKAGEIKNQATGLCIDSAGLKSGDDAVVTTCSDSPSQMWVWSNYS